MQALKRRIGALLSAAALLFVCSFGGVPAAATVQSAGDEWTLGAGWMDYSTADDIVFENLTDQAGPSFNKTLINGAKGFKIDYTIDFLDPAVQTTARIDIRLNSQTLSYFHMLVTGLGNDAMLQVDYFDKGTGQSVVPYTGPIAGANGRVRVSIERMEKSKYVTFTLTNEAGDLLFSRRVTDKAFLGDKYLDASDLEFIVTPVPGYGLFRFSGYSYEAYPYDGVGDKLNASEEWTMPAGWTDRSTADEMAFSCDTDTAGPNFRKDKFNAAGGARLSFDMKPTAATQTTAEVVVRSTRQNLHYIRLLATGNNGSAMVDVNFFNGTDWTQLATTGWKEGAGDEFHVDLEWRAQEQELWLTVSKLDGTPLFEERINTPTLGTGTFFDEPELEALTAPISGYGTFTLTGFTVNTGRAASAEWTMPAGWTDESSFDHTAFSNDADNVGPNFYKNRIDATDGMDLSFTMTVKPKENTANTTADMAVRQTANNNVYLRILPTGNNGSAMLDVNFFDGANWTPLIASGWIEGVGDTFVVRLYRQAGSDTLIATVSKPDGTEVFRKEVKSDVVTGESFYDASELEAVVSPIGGCNRFTIADFAVANAPRTPAEQSDWTLGAGWEAYRDDNGALILAKKDGQPTEAIYNHDIRGGNGFKISYDITFLSTANTTTYFKLRLPVGEERYLFSRIKGGNGSVLAEAQVYDGDWSSSLLSPEAGQWTACGRTVHVSIERQAGLDSIHLILSKTDGTVLHDEAFSHEVLAPDPFLDSAKLQMILGRDSDSSRFQISNFTVTEYPLDPVAATGVSIAGPQEALTGEAKTFTAAVTPGDATIASYAWTVNGQAAGTKPTLTYAFEEAGDYTVGVTVTDRSGNTFDETLTVRVNAPVIVPVTGDVNGDGVVDREDARCILRYAVSAMELTDEQKARADINGNGAIDSTDALLLMEMLDEA